MTLNGAIAELTILWNHSMMPEIFKGSIQKIIETVSECEEPRNGRWINQLNDDGHHIADCSECGHAIQWFDDEDEPKYCCMCGSYNGGQE